ncbi:MAG: radical SAM-associated putative lipoprotein [Bacteroidales bacterium]|jgi:putative lipoprotein (rSAM/lipoprotein system)|nr:radical SAM-associated putative lipoprotein [Bacteroidales bacterium]HPH52972.1 radical SAM-associated putative lipoprotein [Bacteroidales bacterium]
MKKIAIKTYGKILTLFFSMVGMITGCDWFEPSYEYGCPSADYIIKGKVTDKQSKKPIKNIAVIRKAYSSPYGNDTVRTDFRGDYELKYRHFGGEDLIVVEDLDKEKNGGWYAPDSIKVDWKQMQKIKKGDGRWYDGVFLRADTNFELEHQTIALYGVMSAEYKGMKEEE